MESRQLESWTVESLDSGDPGMTRDGLRETPFKRGAKIRLRKSLVYIFFHVAVIKKIKNDYFLKKNTNLLILFKRVNGL